MIQQQRGQGQELEGWCRRTDLKEGDRRDLDWLLGQGTCSEVLGTGRTQEQWQRQANDQQSPNHMETRWSWQWRKTETHYKSRARRGTLGWRQRQVNNLQSWTSLSGQEQPVCFHSQKYSTAGAKGNSLLQTLHVPLLPSITGQAQTSSPPEQGYTADPDSLLMLSGML